MKSIALLQNVDLTGASTGDTIPLLFRCTDQVGLPIAPAADPDVTTASPRARATSITKASDIPGTYEADLRIGRADANGLNVFTVACGDATRDVTFFLQ